MICLSPSVDSIEILQTVAIDLSEQTGQMPKITEWKHQPE